MVRINAPYNVIFSRPLLNELCAVLSAKYLMMKFETDKGIISIKGDHIEAKRECILVNKTTMKQLEVMILEAPEE